MTKSLVLSDFLQALRVPHTVDYTNRQFEKMPFKSLFGLSKLLESYNIDSEGLYLADRSEISKITPPFIAHTPQGFVIVTGFEGMNVHYLTQGMPETMPLSDFEKVWDGNLFLAFPRPNACEPDYAAHMRDLFFAKAKKVGLCALVLFLFVWLFIENGIYRHATTILLVVCDLIGLFMSTMLVRKSMKIKSRVADKVCGVLEEGGCDTVLETKASTFFGIFSWSEVGFTYFSVSLLALLIFPGSIGALAAVNVLCLPFTVWSIWYQKFRAKAWCTMCVSVQTTLWLLFICYLTGGWLKMVFPIGWSFFILIAVYGVVLLSVNRLVPLMKNPNADPEPSSDPVSNPNTKSNLD